MSEARPHFVLALVGAVGSLLSESSALIQAELERYGYQAHVLKVSSSFSSVKEDVRAGVNEALSDETCYPADGRYAEIRRAMATGRAVREGFTAESNDDKSGALAFLAVQAIAELRKHVAGPLCVIVESLKTPGELRILRRVYGERILAVGVHTPQSARRARLVHRIQQTVGRSPSAIECADRLIGIDEKERGTALGQDVEGVFAQCDAYLVAGADDARLRREVERLARLMFLAPFETPTAAEAAMMHAFTASLGSASMARQVGAAITTGRGDLVSTGCNEVPRFGGGPYRSEHASDGRDFTRGQDENMVQKAALVQQLLWIAQQEGLLATDVDVASAATRVTHSPKGRDMLARNLTEFGREVHAEMAALNAAARRGAAVQGCSLYTTTFPCHNCAKHIIDAGISAVTFIEAYPKSFAEAFHTDSLSLEQVAADKLIVQPFEGVAPRAYAALFSWRPRRDERTGRALGHSPLSSRPWFCLGNVASERDVGNREDDLVKASKASLESVFDLRRAVASLLPEIPRTIAKVGRGSEPPSQSGPSRRTREAG